MSDVGGKGEWYEDPTVLIARLRESSMEGENEEAPADAPVDADRRELLLVELLQLGRVEVP